MSSNETIKNILNDLKVADSIVANLARLIETDGLPAIEKLDDFIPKNLQKKLIETLKSEKVIAANLNRQESVSEQFDQIEKEKCLTELKNIHNDYIEMPFCAEKILIHLFYQTRLRTMDNFDSNAIDLNEKQVTKEKLITEVNTKLKECVVKEELDIKVLDQLVQSIKAEDWKRLCEELNRILKKIRPFNISEVRRLINEAEQSSNRIRDADILLLLGETGAGKSSLIHYLAGSKMVNTKVNGLNHIMPIEVENPALKKVNTSPFAKSETRYITAVPINIPDSDEHIWIVDTPGFEDTNGAEIDIANVYSIVKAVKLCKSVRIILLISYKSMGDRLKGIRKLTNLIVGMFSKLNENTSKLKAFSYYFSKFPKQEKSTIHALIGDLISKLNEKEKANANFKTILTDMFNKTEQNCRMIDFFSTEPQTLLIEMMSAEAIHDPDETFRVSITDESKAALKDQLRRHQLSISNALKRFEFALVEFKLSQLKYLFEILELDFIRQSYSQCLNSISQALNDNYQIAISDFNRSFDINNNTFRQDDIQKYFARIEMAKTAQSFLRDKYLHENVEPLDSYFKNLTDQLDSILSHLKENRRIDDTVNKSALDRVKSVYNYFPDTSGHYTDICNHFKETIQNLFNSFKNEILRENDFIKCSQELSKVNKSLPLLKEHLNETTLQETYENMKTSLFDYLRARVNEKEELFNKINLDKEDVDCLGECVSLIESAKKVHPLWQHISFNKVKNIYDEFLNKILDYYEIRGKAICNQIEKNDSFTKIEDSMGQLTLLRQISVVQAKTNCSYSLMFESLCGSINESKREINNELRSISESKENLTYETLLDRIKRLDTAAWIEKYRNGFHKELMNNIRSLIIDHAERLKQTITGVNFNLDSSLEDAGRCIVKLNGMKILNETAPEINAILTETNSWRLATIDRVLKKISCLVTENSNQIKQQPGFVLSYENIEKSIRYLNGCQKIAFLLEIGKELTLVSSSLEALLTGYCDLVKTDLDESFKIIINDSVDNPDSLKHSLESLKSRLEEINNLETKHLKLFEYFTAQNEKWKRNECWRKKLSNYASELTDEMHEIHVNDEMNRLKTKIHILNSLKDLDRDCFSNSLGFTHAHHAYRDIYFKKINDIYSSINESISKKEFNNVAESLQRLKNLNEERAHKLEEIKIKLNRTLADLTDETRFQAERAFQDVSTAEETRNLANNLTKLEAAANCLSFEYFCNLEEIKNEIASIKNTITLKIKKYMENIEYLVESYAFFEANSKLENISIAYRLLPREYAPNEVSKRIAHLKVEKINQILNGLAVDYSDATIEQFAQNRSVYLFEQLEKCLSFSQDFKDTLDLLKEIILQKFRKELKLAGQMEQQNDAALRYLRKFEVNVKYLPHNLKITLETELEYCKRDINNKLRN